MSNKYANKSSSLAQSKSDREKQKLITDKCQSLIEVLLKEDDNKYCVDCDAKGPRWSSWNIGVFLCIRCAGIHRNLGVHISRVKSVNLDAWTPDHVAYVQRMGNKRAREIYEANLPDDFRRPQTDTALESFIRAKYEVRKYISPNYTDPGPPPPAFSVEEELKKMKEQKRNKGSSSANSSRIISLSSAESKVNKNCSSSYDNSPSIMKKPTGLGTGLVDIETIASAVEETNAASIGKLSSKSQTSNANMSALDLLTGDLHISSSFAPEQNLIQTTTPTSNSSQQFSDVFESLQTSNLQEPQTVSSKPKASVGENVLDLDFDFNQPPMINQQQQPAAQNQKNATNPANNVLSKEYILSLYSSPSKPDNNLSFESRPSSNSYNSNLTSNIFKGFQ